MLNTKMKFLTYLKIQRSGVTNMLDFKYVRYLAKFRYKIPLTKKDCIYIIKNYVILKTRYFDEWKEIFERVKNGHKNLHN